MNTKAKIKLHEYTDGQQVYVMNRASMPDAHGQPTKQAGEIIFTVTTEEGLQEALTIPNTFIPINMTLKASLATLKRSVRFANLINSGRLELMDSMEAERQLSTQKFRDEEERLNRVAAGHVESIRSGELSARAAAGQEESEHFPSVNSKIGLFEGVINLYSANSITEGDATNLATSNAKILSLAELEELSTRTMSDCFLQVVLNELESRTAKN